MLTIDHELEITLEALAKKEQISLNEILKRLINHYVSQTQPQELSAKNALDDASTMSQQLEIGREFMREYHETFSELAK